MKPLILSSPDGVMRVGGAVRDPDGRWRADPLLPPEGGWIRFAPLPDGSAALALRSSSSGLELLRVTAWGIQGKAPIRGLPAGWSPPAEIRAALDGWIRAGAFRISPDGEAREDPRLLNPEAVLLSGGITLTPRGILFAPDNRAKRAPWAGKISSDPPIRILAARPDRAILLLGQTLVLAGEKTRHVLSVPARVQAGIGDEKGRWALAWFEGDRLRLRMGRWGRIVGGAFLPNARPGPVYLQRLHQGWAVAFRTRSGAARAEILDEMGRSLEIVPLPLISPRAIPLGEWVLFPPDPVEPAEGGLFFCPALLSPAGELEDLRHAPPMGWATAPWGGALVLQGNPPRLRVFPSGEKQAVPGLSGLLFSLPDGRIAAPGDGFLLILSGSTGIRRITIPSIWKPRGFQMGFRLSGEPFDLLIPPGEDDAIPVRG